MTTHSFDTDEAAKHGILAAIILHNIQFWTEKNRANRRHFYEGKTWVYNSVSAWSELFPYATKDQIRRALEKLRDDGVIEVGNFNQSAYDRTAWYCLSCQMDVANLPNGNGTDATPIPVSNPDSNKNTCDLQEQTTTEKCPVQKIVDLYNEILVDLPSVKRLTEDRKRKIVKLWNDRKKAGKYTDNETGLAYWKQLFEFITESDFLMGRQSGNWKASIDFIFTDSRFTKIIERTYHKEQQ